MITQNYQKILTSLNKYMSTEMGVLNTNLINMFNYTLVHYSRNVFNYKANWKKILRTFDFNYEYINDSKAYDDIIYIEKEFRKYGRYFKTKIHIKNDIHLDKYIKFIQKAMSMMVNKIIIPIECIMERYTDIILLYRNIYKEEKVQSKKINYDVLNEFKKNWGSN